MVGKTIYGEIQPKREIPANGWRGGLIFVGDPTPCTYRENLYMFATTFL